jgi:amino acid transporter
MKDAKYGLALGLVLSGMIIMGYSFPQIFAEGPRLFPLSLVGALLGLGFLVFIGYGETRNTGSVRKGIILGALTGFIALTIVGLTFFAVHNVFFYEQASREPEKIEGWLKSGLGTMREYLIYNNIRSGILGIVMGTIAGGVCGLIGAGIARMRAGK